MPQITFSPDWLRQFSDPYAVLGLSVTADDRRVLKRYHNVAKFLHPDSFTNADPATREVASQIFARLVNPSYQKLKQEKGRAEHMALLRFRVRRASRDEPFSPQSDVARQLTGVALTEIDVFYEQAIDKLAADQYRLLEQFATITQDLGELNLIYLRLKMGEPIIREKRSGIVPATPAGRVATVVLPQRDEEKDPAEDYDRRHYRRAEEYVRKANWSLAIRELQEAIKLKPTQSEYHSLLAKAYLMQDLPIMAKVHFRQALKLNPKDPLAVEYAKKLQITIETPQSPNKNAKASGGGGLFGLFAKKR